MKKLLVTILTLLLCLGTIAGCGTAPASGSAPSEAAPVVPPAASSAPSEAVPAATAAPSASSPAVSAADASAPAPVGDAAKKAILVVSFGTSYNVTREATIGAVEKAIAAAYPDFDVRRAFTSQMIIKKLKTRDQLEIDNVQQAIERLIADGVGTLVVQPTHVMNGFEYDEMRATIAPFEA
ncbi:MAG: sirohydrochlorin cobaltochelatase, partial [Oscillospiraceae bacterium]